MDRLEELGTGRYFEPFRIRAVCQAKEPPHQGASLKHSANECTAQCDMSIKIKKK